jgi:hypothetical protein
VVKSCMMINKNAITAGRIVWGMPVKGRWHLKVYTEDLKV